MTRPQGSCDNFSIPTPNCPGSCLLPSRNTIRSPLPAKYQTMASFQPGLRTPMILLSDTFFSFLEDCTFLDQQFLDIRAFAVFSQLPALCKQLQNLCRQFQPLPTYVLIFQAFKQLCLPIVWALEIHRVELILFINSIIFYFRLYVSRLEIWLFFPQNALSNTVAVTWIMPHFLLFYIYLYHAFLPFIFLGKILPKLITRRNCAVISLVWKYLSYIILLYIIWYAIIYQYHNIFILPNF